MDILRALWKLRDVVTQLEASKPEPNSRFVICDQCMDGALNKIRKAQVILGEEFVRSLKADPTPAEVEADKNKGH